MKKDGARVHHVEKEIFPREVVSSVHDNESCTACCDDLLKISQAKAFEHGFSGATANCQGGSDVVLNAEHSEVIPHDGDVSKPFVCGVCHKSFSRKQNMQKHELTHRIEKIYECELCQRRFKHEQGLKEHSAQHTGDRPYNCEFCGKRFASKNTLRIHYRYHKGEKQHVCEVCGKRYIFRSELKKHKVIHSGEKPHVCSVCDKAFALLGTLLNHERTHVGKKLYVCGTCDKKFTDHTKYELHRCNEDDDSSFENGKSCVCKYCEKTFSFSTALRRHLVTHTGEKPYFCRMCGVGFTQKCNLDRHKKTPKHKQVVEEAGLL